MEIRAKRETSFDSMETTKDDNSKEFDGKTILVTGAGQGIGKDVCVELARRGGNVIAVSRTLSNLESLQTEIQNEGGKCSIYSCDFEKPDEVKTTIEKALETNQVDLLVNNAGTNILSSFLEAKSEDWDVVMNVNLKSAFIVSQVVARQMVKNKIGGSIVNVSSQASVVAVPEHTAYCVSKGGLDQLSRMMASELGQYGIRVNSINPTVVMTKLGKESIIDILHIHRKLECCIKEYTFFYLQLAWGSPEKGDPMLAKIPLKKFAEVSDVTNAVLYGE